MTLIRSTKFTPDVLISAPRRSDVVPNASGTHGLFTVSTYDLETHKEHKEIKVLKLNDASPILFSSDSGDNDPQWLGDSDLILYQRSNDSEETEFWIGSGIGEKNSYYAGKIESAVFDLKVVQLKDGNVGITFCSPTSPKGKIFNPKSSDKPKHTGRDYTTAPIRVWTEFKERYRHSLYYTVFIKETDGRWRLSKKDPINSLKGTKLQYPICPSATLGETGTYNVGSQGILVCTVDPAQNYASSILFRPYFIRLNSFQEPRPKIVQLKTEEYVGTADTPSFSNDGKFGAFTVSRTKHAMLSERGIAWFHVDDERLTQDSHALVNLYKFTDGKKTTWDRFPSALLWSQDNKALYINAEDVGYQNLFKLDVDSSESKSGIVSKLVKAPKQLTKETSISSVALLDRNNESGSKILFTSSTYVEPSLYSIIDGSTSMIRAISSHSSNGLNLGLSSSQCESITFPGDKTTIQAHIMRPSFFDPKKKYPLALIVHGGPQSQWKNSWSTRWNPALWAEQGYVVLLPNPAGSTGFGLECMAAVTGDWGGRPYRDIVKAVDYVVDNMDYVDGSNIIMAGASYGGYMACWIAGQPLAKRLKTIVCHDGIFHAASMLASDFVADLDIDVGGDLTKPQVWEKWSPFTYAQNWTTPMLIVHSDLDYRCPINEGLAPFNVCQAKGIPSRFLYFPDEGHFVLKRENSLKWCNTVLGWFNHYAGITDGVKLEPANCDAVFDEDSDEDEDEETKEIAKKVKKL